MARNYIGLPFGVMIALGAILLLAPDSHGQGITFKKKQFTVSGNVSLGNAGLANVTLTLSGVPAPVVTDSSGAFSVQVNYGWSGTIARG